MAKTRSIGNSVAPWRFIVFLAVLVIGAVPASIWLGSWSLGIIDAFDVAGILFLLLSWRVLTVTDPTEMERIALSHDANRTLLLIITGIVITVLLIAVGSETVGHNHATFAKALIIVTLIVAWLFGNTVYALHYAHMAYVTPEVGCAGFRFPGTPQPVYWDFVYFAFTCGMAFATSDVEVTDQRIRKVVTFHCLAAFGFNIGVLAFTVNLLASGGG
jgi:uncharacterized membrane protein